MEKKAQKPESQKLLDNWKKYQEMPMSQKLKILNKLEESSQGQATSPKTVEPTQ